VTRSVRLVLARQPRSAGLGRWSVLVRVPTGGGAPGAQADNSEALPTNMLATQNCRRVTLTCI